MSKTVLITGAFGTWGSEYTRQLLEAGHKVVGIGRDEKAAAEYGKKFPEANKLIGDFYDVALDSTIDVLIHAAAYKHIDLCEANPVSAIDNNVSKTMALYQEAAKLGIKICFISTDKAVAPYSVYGMTKALGERLTWQYKGYVARSGNIAGSNGSVIHTWRKNIENNEPLTVTDMNMERYFISVEDAVRISWEGFEANKKLTLIDEGGKLKLGDIIDKVLAEKGFTFQNYKPGIKIIGMREGVERLVDDIYWPFDDKYLDEETITEQRGKLYEYQSAVSKEE